MGLVANGIYGYRTSLNATALGTLPKKNKTFATNTLTWQGGANLARESVSYPSGYFTSAFYMPLKDGGIATKVVGTGTMIADSTLVSFLSYLTASLTGSGTLSSAELYKGINLLATISGAGTVTSASMSPKAWMQALISIGASPSAFDIAQAVWGSVAAQNNTNGTMGQKLNGAGSAGDPWSDERALTVGKFLGLK